MLKVPRLIPRHMRICTFLICMGLDAAPLFFLRGGIFVPILSAAPVILPPPRLKARLSQVIAARTPGGFFVPAAVSRATAAYTMRHFSKLTAANLQSGLQATPRNDTRAGWSLPERVAKTSGYR